MVNSADMLPVYISTHTPLAGRDPILTMSGKDLLISTHTPLAGRDIPGKVSKAALFDISTHTPLAGRDTQTDKTFSRK